VIGNGDYQYPDNLPKLANPVHDAEDIAKALRGFGFEVIERKNQTREAMLLSPSSRQPLGCRQATHQHAVEFDDRQGRFVARDGEEAGRQESSLLEHGQ
jgi:hypothetical protein